MVRVNPNVPTYLEALVVAVDGGAPNKALAGCPLRMLQADAREAAIDLVQIAAQPQAEIDVLQAIVVVRAKAPHGLEVGFPAKEKGAGDRWMAFGYGCPIWRVTGLVLSQVGG